MLRSLCCALVVSWLTHPVLAGGVGGGDIPPIPGAFVETGSVSAPGLGFEGAATTGSGVVIDPSERVLALAGGAGGSDTPPIPGAFVDAGAGSVPGLDFGGAVTTGSGVVIGSSERGLAFAGGATGSDTPPIPGAFVDAGSGTAPDLEFWGGVTSGSGAEIEPGERAIALTPLDLRDADGRIVARVHRFVTRIGSSAIAVLRDDGSVTAVFPPEDVVDPALGLSVIYVLSRPGETVPHVAVFDS